MDNYQSFTVDPTNFKDIATFASDLHSNNQKIMVVIGPHLSKSDHDSFYTEAAQQKLLIKSSINKDEGSGDALTQVIWPGLSGSDYESVFLDWFNPASKTIWHQALNKVYESVEFDGLWLDMNEATGVCNGECPGGKTQ